MFDELMRIADDAMKAGNWSVADTALQRM